MTQVGNGFRLMFEDCLKNQQREFDGTIAENVTGGAQCKLKKLPKNSDNNTSRIRDNRKSGRGWISNKDVNCHHASRGHPGKFQIALDLILRGDARVLIVCKATVWMSLSTLFRTGSVFRFLYKLSNILFTR